MTVKIFTKKCPTKISLFLKWSYIKGYLLRTAYKKSQLKQRTFSSFSTRLHIGRFKAAPYKSSKWSLAKVPVSSVSRIDIGTFFRFMMKQQLKKRKIYKKNGHSRNNKYSKSFCFSYGSSSDLLSTEPH